MKKCSKCKLQKSLENFSWMNKKKKILQSMCKNCFKKYDKTRIRDYTKNGKHYKSQRKNKEKYYKIVIDILKKNPCSLCKEKDILVLEFDHIIPKTKSFSICEGVNKGVSMKRFIEEIKKCRVLCANCHRRETAKSMNFWKINFNDGT